MFLTKQSRPYRSPWKAKEANLWQRFRQMASCAKSGMRISTDTCMCKERERERETKKKHTHVDCMKRSRPCVCTYTCICIVIYICRYIYNYTNIYIYSINRGMVRIHVLGACLCLYGGLKSCDYVCVHAVCRLLLGSIAYVVAEGAGPCGGCGCDWLM